MANYTFNFFDDLTNSELSDVYIDDVLIASGVTFYILNVINDGVFKIKFIPVDPQYTYWERTFFIPSQPTLSQLTEFNIIFVQNSIDVAYVGSDEFIRIYKPCSSVVYFIDNVAQINIFSVEWNFGDLTAVQSGFVVSHTYSSAGQYLVSKKINYCVENVL